tara:strand:+ start:261 stop:923 length:663 start_codon:yes stop_codon:yes gene_type:complete
MSNNNYNPDDIKKLNMADKIIEWSFLEGKDPMVNEEYRHWMLMQDERYIRYIKSGIEEKINVAMADKIIEWSILEDIDPFEDEDMLENEMREWLYEHDEYDQYIQDQIEEKIKIKISKRKTLSTILSLKKELPTNIIRSINNDRKNINKTGGGRKYKKTGKKSKNKKKHIMSVKIKKELKNLTKDWINTLSQKKIYTKKNVKKKVNKFIKTLKNKCDDLY